MFSFKNDYSEGAHPAIMEALAKAGFTQNKAYGKDSHSFHAADLIREQIGCADADVHFMVGGTQTNLTAIAAFLRPYEAAVCAQSGHINVHETGAVEATGHKAVVTVSADGKLTPDSLEQAVKSHTDEHMVKPKLVYISNSTEIGTVYSKKELEDLSAFCKQNGLYLYLDGARLGSALTCGSDLTLRDLPRLTDAFYIGGTKNGALFGEALVIVNPALKDDFRYMIKQRGAMLAKGMALGVQFEVLFQNNLYFDLAAHANKMAAKLRESIAESGFTFLTDSPTNQIFPILPDNLVEKLRENYDFELWEKRADNTSVIRLVTSWATPESMVEKFIQDFKNLA